MKTFGICPFLLLACSASIPVILGFTVPPAAVIPSSSRQSAKEALVLWQQPSSDNNKKSPPQRNWNQEIEEKSRRRASSSPSGGGETVAGAVLGGLLGGPFGAIFGASLGSSMGAKNAIDRARQDELKRLGLTQEMLDSAQQIGVALEQCQQGLQQVQESLETQQRLAKRLDFDAETYYDKAKEAMAQNQEDDAREYLLQRQKVQDRLKQVLENCITAKQQVQTMEQNAAALETRAMEMEALLQRTVGATALQNTEPIDQSLARTKLSSNDPLLQKFQDLGID